MTEQANLDAHQAVTSPFPQPGAALDLLPEAELTDDLEDAASGVVSVINARRVALWIAYDAASGADGAFPLIVPLVSGERNAPDTTDDAWYSPAVLADPADVDGYDAHEAGALGITLPAVGSEESSRRCVVLDVTHARWMRVQAAESGDTSEPGTLTIRYSMAL